MDLTLAEGNLCMRGEKWSQGYKDIGMTMPSLPTHEPRQEPEKDKRREQERQKWTRGSMAGSQWLHLFTGASSKSSPTKNFCHIEITQQRHTQNDTMQDEQYSMLPKDWCEKGGKMQSLYRIPLLKWPSDETKQHCHTGSPKSASILFMRENFQKINVKRNCTSFNQPRTIIKLDTHLDLASISSLEVQYQHHPPWLDSVEVSKAAWVRLTSSLWHNR